MMPLETIQDVLSKRPKPLASDKFLSQHRHLEGYVKRVALIGLRLNEVRYDIAKRVIEGSYMTLAAMIEKAIVLCDRSGRRHNAVLSEYKKKHREFFVLNKLFLEFACPYRNRLAHGVTSKLKDLDVLRCLCHINHSYYLAFEAMLHSEHGHSAFEKPGKWGATIGRDEDLAAAVSRIRFGRLVSEPMNYETVLKQLSSTQYGQP